MSDTLTLTIPRRRFEALLGVYGRARELMETVDAHPDTLAERFEALDGALAEFEECADALD